MRRRANIDANQPEIVRALRAIPGCTVELLHQLGGGVPDLLVGWRGANLLLEVKDGDKPPSKRALTPDEEAWHATWRGQVVVVNSVAEAIAAMGLEVEKRPRQVDLLDPALHARWKAKGGR